MNRDQIGAIVGSQPFGGEGLSGTGPKAGGPHYLPRFAANMPARSDETWRKQADLTALQAQLRDGKTDVSHPVTDLPGPTGESNRHSTHARGPILCMGPGAAAAAQQVTAVTTLGGIGIAAGGSVLPADLITLTPLAGVIWWGDDATGRAIETALSQRKGPITALVTGIPDAAHVLHERHVCVDTTAAGGNAALLAEVAGDATT